MTHPSSHRFTLLGALLLTSALVALPACTGRSTSAIGKTPAAAAPIDEKAPADQADPTRIHAARIPVAFGDVRRLAVVLETVLDARPRGSGPVRAVLVDERTGELVVLGTDEGIARARAILSPACDLPKNEAAEVEVVRLEHAAARAIVHTVAPLLGPGARVTADEPTNSIVIQGLATDRARARQVIAALDTPKADG